MSAKPPHQLCQKTNPPPPGKKTYSITNNVEAIVAEASKLKEDERFALFMELIKKSNFSQPRWNTIKNTITGLSKKRASEELSIVNSRAQASSDVASAHATPDAKSTDTLSTYKILPSPAAQVPLIVRGDLIKEGTILCLDVEKIIDVQHKNVAGDFALVDLKGRLVVWCYINRDSVCRYNTKMTGLSKEKMEMGVPVELLKNVLDAVLKCNKLVGAAVNMDLQSIDYTPPQATTTEDIQHFFKDKYGDPISLSLLGQHFIGENIQEGTHSSIKDARMTALCYKKMEKMKCIGLHHFSCPQFDDFRDAQKQQKKLEKSKSKNGWERCTCGFTKQQQRKQTWSNPNNVNIDVFFN